MPQNFIHTGMIAVICLVLLSCGEPYNNLRQDQQNHLLLEAKSRGRLRPGVLMQYHLDQSSEAEIQQIIQPDTQWQSIHSEYPTFGITNNSIWLKLKLNLTDSEDWLLELAAPLLTEVQFYIIQEGQLIRKSTEKQSTPILEREIPHQHYLFHLTAKSGVQTIYLRVKSVEASTIPIFIWRKSFYHYMEPVRTFAFGLVFGVILALALYNFFLFLSIRDRAYLYYVLYIISMGVFLWNVYGFGIRQVSWLNPHLLHASIPFLSILTTIFALAFTNSFLYLRKNLRRVSKIIDLFNGFMLTCFLAFFFLDISTRIAIGNLLPIIGVGLVIFSLVKSLQSGFKPARYFLIAWSGLLFFIVLFILANLGIIGGNFYTQYGQLFGVTFEAIMLSQALGYRINELRTNEEQARLQILSEQKKALDKQKQLSDSFARFVPTQFLNYLNRQSILEVEQGDAISRKMAVLFTDIRGFTGISEDWGSQKTFRFLNDYLARMEPIIKDNNGFIDKFIGDAIMALFPSANASLSAAIRMARAVSDLHQSDQQLQSIRTGIGLHFGNLTLGTLGSPQRLDTTVIGDTVNLASRLENANKDYHSQILLSDSFYRKLSEEHQEFIRELDTVYVQGKTQPIVIYECFAFRPPEEREPLRKNMYLFLQATSFFRSAQFQKAAGIFRDYQALCPFDLVAGIYLKRIQELEVREPDPEWQGIYHVWK